MNNQQMTLWNKMRSMIRQNKRKFHDRNDRNIYEDLYDLGLTVEDAWKEILQLNKHFYVIDNMPFYRLSAPDVLAPKPQYPHCLRGN